MSKDHHVDMDRLASLFQDVGRLGEAERQALLERIRAQNPELGQALEDFAAGGAPDGRAAPKSLAERIRERYGSEADPGITLKGKEEGPGPDFASELIARLTKHGSSFGRYELKGEVARGGQGAILRVWDTDLRRNLAMKVVLGQAEARPEKPAEGAATPPVDSRTLGRFLEEAQVTGQLDHPGIVPVHELGLDAEGRVYFTMKLVKGRDLKAIFEQVQRGEEGWNETRALGVLLKVCEAMAYAHAKEVIHRDLKPANVMVGRYGEVYVMDWGLARVLGREDHKDLRIRPDLMTSEVRSGRREHAAAAPDSPLMTMDGDVVGTPAYMSPEQARGDLPAMGPASDVYAVGAMLYHLLASRMPYVPESSRLNNYAIWFQVQKGPPEPLEEVAPKAPAELVAICEKAMARAPGDRYPDMEALAVDLRAFLEHRVVNAYETGAIPELRKWVGRNKGLAASIAAAVLVALSGLGGIGYVQAQGKAAAQREERIAMASAKEAQRQKQFAEANAEKARRERANVLRLSAFQRLQDLEREAEELWPAGPENRTAYNAWIGKAKALVAGLEPSGEGKDRGHLAQLAELEARALPQTEEEKQADRESHPRYGELKTLEARIASLKRAQAVREKEAEVEEPDLSGEKLPSDANALNNLAWPLVDPDRTAFGGEARGLALARKAVGAATTDKDRATFGDTLAWAFFACGLDEKALDAEREALQHAPKGDKKKYQGYLEKLGKAVEEVKSGAVLARLEKKREALEAEVSARRTWKFASEEDRWWHAQLEKLVAAVEAFADPKTGLWKGTSEKWGLGIEGRQAWAATVGEKTVTGPEAKKKWAAAIASIADPKVCPAYHGLRITPQLGLVPIGRDPESGLWEFGHPLTGTVPKRGPDGKLILTEDMGLVFVLLPGGKFRMGAQAKDPQGRHFDPQAASDEDPVHQVELSPFFLSKYEMTQGQWKWFTGSNPSLYNPKTYGRTWNAEGKPGDLLHPVEQVSWWTSTKVCGRLGLLLPSEAQWEYGARSGTETIWWTGDKKESLAGAANLADSYAKKHGGSQWGVWEAWDDGNTSHARVGSYRANAFGLFDTAGNVWEWCRDAYEKGFYGRSPLKDPVNIASGSGGRVLRGGSFGPTAVFARSADRSDGTPAVADGSLGLRPARVITGSFTSSPPSSGPPGGR